MMELTGGSAEVSAKLGASEDDSVPPPLQSIAPAIFLPLEADLTKPVSPPRDRTERLKRILESVELNRKGVRENLMRMFELEMRRIRILATEHEREHPDLVAKAGFHPDEADALVAMLDAPAIPGANYKLTLPPLNVATRPPAEYSLRELTAHEMLVLVERALDQLHGYGDHLDKIKQEYLAHLEKEVARFGTAGQASEERARK